MDPICKARLLALLTSLDPLTEPFPDIDDDLPPLDTPADHQYAITSHVMEHPLDKMIC